MTKFFYLICISVYISLCISLIYLCFSLYFWDFYFVYLCFLVYKVLSVVFLWHFTIFNGKMISILSDINIATLAYFDFDWHNYLLHWCIFLCSVIVIAYNYWYLLWGHIYLLNVLYAVIHLVLTRTL